MKFLKKAAISSLAMATLFTPMAAGAVQAKGEGRSTNQECRQLRSDQQRIIDHIYFGSSWQLNKFQKLTNDQNDKNCKARYSTVDYLERFGNFTSLTAALKYTGLDATLNGPGPFTVLAPTDDAFAKLPASLVQSLLTDPAQKSTLSNILLYHVVGGAKVDAATASTLTSATAANGSTFKISQKNGSLYINDSKVVLYDIKTTNGIIHVIDTVLVPSS